MASPYQSCAFYILTCTMVFCQTSILNRRSVKHTRAYFKNPSIFYFKTLILKYKRITEKNRIKIIFNKIKTERKANIKYKRLT